MNIQYILKWTFLASFFLVPLGAFMKILHSPTADFFLGSGLVCTGIALAIGIYEVRTSSRLNKHEKFIWTVGLLFLTFIALPLYSLKVRKRTIA
jgi:uncharacterized membrane protein YozB (DUF420 family)